MVYPIKVYCTNLASQHERRKHTKMEFLDKSEFALRIVHAIQYSENCANGLYYSFILILLYLPNKIMDIHISFFVVNKVEFEKITNSYKKEDVHDICIDRTLVIVLEYKFITYLFLTSNRGFHLDTDTKHMWYNNVISHFIQELVII